MRPVGRAGVLGEDGATQLPKATADWVEGSLGPRTRIVSVAPCSGGEATLVHRVVLRAPDREVILKRFFRRDWLRRQPEVVAQEADALDFVAPLALPTPALVAVDPRGERADHPALLMSALPGRVALPRAPDSEMAERLARPLAVLAAFRPPGMDRLRPYRRFHSLDAFAPPSWSSVPERWAQARDCLRGPAPPFEPSVVHRDYHPTNLLWHGSELSGVLDWTEACIGPAELDLAHCRLNLVQLYGVEFADLFRDHWVAALGRRGPAHPYWDLWSLLDWDAGSELYGGWAELGATWLTLDRVRRRLDTYVVKVLERLSKAEC